MFRIELLPAAYGDAIWVEYGDPGHPRRIVIDGGPAPTYEQGLYARFKKLKKGDRIDLFIVTHIDSDHIDGAIILMQQVARSGVEIGEMWFNAWPQLEKAGPEIYAPIQGEFLGAQIEEAGLKGIWNTRTEGKVIQVPDDQHLPAWDLDDKTRLTLLSPGPAQIRRLRARWDSAMRQFCGDTKAALDRLKDRREYRPPELQPVFGGKSLGGDRSVANGSSIAFLLEHDGASCLFAGDAFPRVLAANLRRLSNERNPGRAAPIRLDAFKLSHHGSYGNVSDDLISAVECSRWLVSTNGDFYEHPHEATGPLIAKHAPGSEFICNYESKTTVKFADKSDSPRWRTSYPGKGVSVGETGGILLDLVPITSAAPANTAKENAGDQEKPGKARRTRSRRPSSRRPK